MTISLEALTARVSARVAADEQLKKAKEQVKKARSESERQAANEAAAEIAARIDWQAKALVLRLERWKCRCGNEGVNASDLFIYYEHTRIANAIRLAPPRHESNADLNRLPRYTQELKRVTTLCQECAGANGFRFPLPRS